MISFDSMISPNFKGNKSVTKYYSHCCVAQCKDRVKKIDVRGIKEGIRQKEQGKHEGCDGTKLTRGAEKKMRDLPAGSKRWRVKRQKTAKGMKNEASDCSGDWLQLVVMIAAGRRRQAVCVCTGGRLVKAALRGELKSIALVKD